MTVKATRGIYIAGGLLRVAPTFKRSISFHRYHVTKKLFVETPARNIIFLLVRPLKYFSQSLSSPSYPHSSAINTCGRQAAR
jgi:hypothetical protein